jgi:enterochelin esterase family protein
MVNLTWRTGFVVAVAALAAACGGDDSNGTMAPGNAQTGGAAGMSSGASGAGQAGTSTNPPDAASATDAPGTGGGANDAAAPGDATAEGGSRVTDPGTDGDGNSMIQSPFKADPAQTVRANVAKGQRIDFTMSSADSKIFPTDTGGAAFMRPAAIYLPNGYASGQEVPFMVAQDGVHGIAYVNTMPVMLDNLIFDKKLPQMAVIFVDPGPGGQRSREYDTVSDAYTRFVETELIPAAKAAVKAKVALDLVLTSDPEGRGSMGGSSGGACAFTMGWFHPELYRRILTYSGSFTKLRPDATYPDGAAEYHEHLIAMNNAKPLRVFLEVGSNDIVNTAGDWHMANDAMAAVLAAKSYHYRYVYAVGAGHVDGGVLTQTLAETMLWLWRGYPIE